MSGPLLRKAGLLEDETGLHLLTLSVLLVDTFGPEVLLWDFTALREELEERWGKIGPVTWQRIMALTVLHLHDAAWQEWEIFENMVAAIIGEMPIFSYVQPPEPEEMAIALETFRRVDNHQLSDEVKDYIVAACLNDGMWYLDGTPLEVAQPSLTEYDLRLGIDRDVGSVAKALRGREGYYKDPETAAEVQANHVLGVQQALERYTAEVDQQLRDLPGLMRRHSP
jgi:hypothetical protein